MRAVLKYLGYLLLIFAIFPVLPAVAAMFYGDPVSPFFIPMVISFALGYWIVAKVKNHKDVTITSFDIPRSISLFALSFISISFIGTIPYLMISRFSFIDALFESVSGFTTTGLTIFMDVESVSRSLLLWRAETQWIGGLSIVLLFLVIISAMRRQQSLKETTTKAWAIANLYQAQGASDRLEANMKKSIKRTMIIYGAYTLAGILLLIIAGLSAFEAVSMSFTAISTAGFSVTNEFYTSWPVLAVISFLMIAGSLSFVVHNHLFKGKIKGLLKNRTIRFYALTFIIAFAIFFSFVDDFKVSFFQTLSAFTTTGYSITNISFLPAVAILILVLGMMMGGMIGSTCGGMKANRIKLMLRSIPWMIRKAASPSGAIIPLKNDGMPVENEQMMITQAFIACYMLLLFLGTMVLLFTGLSFLDSSFQMVSALGGVGLSTTSPALFHPVAKLTLIVSMLFGRLEIIPLLVLGRFIFERGRMYMRKKDDATRKLFYIRWSPAEIWKKKL